MTSRRNTADLSQDDADHVCDKCLLKRISSWAGPVNLPNNNTILHVYIYITVIFCNSAIQL